MQNSVANVQQTVTIFYPDAEPLLKYSPVTLHLSPLLVLMKTLMLLFQFNPYFIIIPLSQTCYSKSCHTQSEGK